MEPQLYSEVTKSKPGVRFKEGWSQRLLPRRKTLLRVYSTHKYISCAEPLNALFPFQLSLEKKVLQSVGQRSNYNSNNNNSSNIVNGGSSTLTKSKSTSACEPKLSGSTFASVTPLKLDDQFNGTIPSVTPSSGDAAAIVTPSIQHLDPHFEIEAMGMGKPS